MALLAVVAAPAAGQSAPPAGGAAKDPSQARALSMLVPGLGHLYAGEARRGGVLLAVAGGSLAAFAADCAVRECVMGPASGVGVGALVAYAGAWVYGVRDAADAARRRNAAATQGDARSPGAYVAPAPAGGVRVGWRAPLGRAAR